MSPTLYRTLAAILFVSPILFLTWSDAGYPGLGCGKGEEPTFDVEKSNRASEDFRREQARLEYEERTRGPCGPKIEIINASGDAATTCQRDLAAHAANGWIVRYPDAGTP